jgi:prevent-host-death family protein
MIGVRELRDNLSRHLAAVKKGQTITVTEHRRPIARIVPADGVVDRLAELIALGEAEPPRRQRLRRPRPIQGAGTITDLIKQQRR